MRNLAKLICQYNGQKGTEKQIEKCMKMFHGSIELMEQFAKNRIKNNMKVEIICTDFWEIGDGYGRDANFIAKMGDKSVSFGYVNEYQLPSDGTFEQEEVLSWGIIPEHVKDWIRVNKGLYA